MASEQKAQFERFETIAQALTYDCLCNGCPVKEQCYAIDDDSYEHSCEEALWHYIMTGEFLK